MRRTRTRRVREGLVVYDSKDPASFELGGAAVGSCRFARSPLRDDGVMLEGDGRPVTRVRFCWGDSPLCNLYDADGLPVGPFEVPVK